MAPPTQNIAAAGSNPGQLITAAPPQPQPSFPVGALRIPTIRHSQYVQRLNPRALDPRQYQYVRTPGNVAGDHTTFLASQQYWGPDRVDRPSVLFQLYPPVNRVTADPGLLFTPSPTTAFPELEVVVDDRDGQPLRHFPELPIVISTKVEGWLLEAWMRLNTKLKHEDIIQRMPHLTTDYWSKKNDGGGFKNTLSARRRDFRQIGRCLSWEENSARKSAFDRRLLDDVASNPQWQAAQTTQYLEDLTLDEKKELIAANSKVRGGTKDSENGSGNVASPLPPKRRREKEPDGQPGSKVPKVDDSIFPLPEFDWDQIHADAERARQKVALGGNVNDTTTIVDQYVDARTVHQNAPPPAPQEPAMLDGQALVDELARQGVTYMPQYQLPVTSSDAVDARYTIAQSSEDRRQLFLAIHPTLWSILKQHPLGRYKLDLSSYAAVFNQLQDQYVHVSFLEDRDLDIAQAQQMQRPLPAWAGAISDFDSIWVPLEEWEDVEGREWNKVHNTPYVFSPSFQEKIEAMGMMDGDERALVVWPRKLLITGDFCLERLEWVVQMTDFE